jgi:rsbT co-antagonist protein RsbR
MGIEKTSPASEAREVVHLRTSGPEAESETVALLRERVKLLDLAQDTIMARRLDGTITYWNHGAARMYGYSAEEAVGHRSHDLLSTSFSTPRDEIERSLLEVGYWEGELQHTGRKGLVVVDSRWVLERDEQGAPRGVLEINNDITRRKEAEAERERQAVVLREQAKLLDLARDAIMVRRFDGIITYWNRGAERMYGFTREEAMGQMSHALLRTGFPAELATIERELRAKDYWEGELLHVRRDGSTLAVDSRWSLQRDEAGKDLGVLEINTDISARKKAEAEEARARQQQEVIRAQALAIAELSTPLIPITDQILVMPLVGLMDSNRASRVMQSLLEGIASSRGQVAIVDVTGVAMIDTMVANALVRAAHAVRLLGAEVVLTGIRPDVAHTLVSIGAELGNITTCGTLQAGIAYALRKCNRTNTSGRAELGSL